MVLVMLMERITSIGKTYRHAIRYREILRVFLKHGLGDLVRVMGGQGKKSWFGRRAQAAGWDDTLTRYARVRLVLEELGPTFVKFGQLLSLRRDFVPPELIDELVKLQDQVPPFPDAEARKIVAASLGRPIDTVFRELRERPLASASIAQVHEGWLLNGTHVVVKVRRPDIVQVMETDLEIMLYLAGLAERHVEEAAVFEPVNLVREFTRLTRSELDLSTEAAHLERFARLFTGNATIHVPKVYRELCGDPVLVMEFIDGVKVSEMNQFAAHGIDPLVVADRGAELILEQIFIHGFFHGDPHPGNLMVLPGNVICFIDYGQMGVLSGRQREQFSTLIAGVVAGDERRITDAVFNLSGYCRFDQAARLEGEILNFVDSYLYKRLGEVNIGMFLTELTRLLISFDIHMPPEFFMLCKTLTTLDGVGRQLSPEFDGIKAAAPLAKRLLSERFSPGRLARDVAGTGWDYYELAREFPREARELFKLTKNGELRFKIEHRGLEPLEHQVDLFGRRVAYALILGALMLGSAMLFRSEAGPRWHGMSILGLLGFSAGLFFSIPVLWVFFRQNRK